MKHPLTSKERRGLAAVAVAALLCIAAGPLLRGCSGSNNGKASNGEMDVERVMDDDSTKSGNKTDSIESKTKKTKSKSTNKKSKKSTSKKTTTKKVIPVRNPLDQPCDK